MNASGPSHMDPATRAELGTWTDYYAGALSIPQVYTHLTNMSGFIARCQRWFPGERVLEIGTGTGIVSVFFQQSGYRVTGLDYEYGVLRQNQALDRAFGASVRWVQGDMFALPFRTGAFDAVFHQGLMEHFDAPDIVQSLREQLRVARRVVFTVPTVRWRGGTYGDERMWAGSAWKRLLGAFHIRDVFGDAYGTLPDRLLHFAGKRLTKWRPGALFRAHAMARAGEIGFVIEAP